MPVIKPKKLLFVLNPISGGTEKDPAEKAIRLFCKEMDLRYRIYKTTGDDDRTAIRRKITRFKPDVIVASGGDGTVHLTANTIIDKDIPLGILPLGSGNGLAKELNIPLEPDKALEFVLVGNYSSYDVLTINDKHSMHISGFGFNAQIIKHFSETEKRGVANYALGMLQEFFPYEPSYYEVETDNHNFKGEAFMVTIANSRSYGSKLTINPDGKMDDGIFEICIIRPFPKSASVKLLYQLFNRELNLSEYITIYPTRNATIKNPQNAAFHIDGEPQEAKEVKVGIIPGKLKIIRPEKEPD